MFSHLPKIISAILIIVLVWNISATWNYIGSHAQSLTASIIVANILLWGIAFLLFTAEIEEV